MENKIKVVEKIYTLKNGTPMVVYLHANYLNLLEAVESPTQDEVVSEVFMFLPVEKAMRDINRIDHRKIIATGMSQNIELFVRYTGCLEDGNTVELISYADFFRLILCTKLSELDHVTSMMLNKELLEKITEPTVFKGFNLCNHLFNEMMYEFIDPPTAQYHTLEN